MPPRRFRALWILPVVAVVLVFLLVHERRQPRWRTLHSGIEFTTLHGDPFCRRGSSAIAVLRVDPARARFEVHHYTREGAGSPFTILEWQRRTGALAVFNAGQFYNNWSYMGVLVCGGDTVSAKRHPTFKAAFVATPESGPRRAQVLDLESDPLKSRRWRDVAQSFMLFDRGGGVRVRNGTRIAARTVVGEDRDGHIVVLTSEGDYTLADFAKLLMRAPLRLTHAMAMDGGLEAEMVIKSDAFRYASFGNWDGRTTDAGEPGAQTELPAVIAVRAP